MHIPFDNSFSRLPERFYARLDPTPVAEPKLVRLNVALAEQLGIDPGALAGPDGLEVLAGNRVPKGAEPLALAYAGHQFGHFVPQLGDGRANLLGEVVGRDGVRRDIQLKGSGPTPFSRRGNGGAGGPDDAHSGRCDNGRGGVAGNDAAGRGADAGGGDSYPGRHVPVFRCPQG